MAKRSKANPGVSARSKLEMLEKRRLLSTTLAVDAPLAPDTGSSSEISQPATGGADGSNGVATDTSSGDPTTTLILPTDPIASDSPVPLDPAVLPTDPITPIAFEDVGTLIDPASVAIDVSGPIDPVKFVDPTLPTDPSATDPTAIDPTTVVDPTTVADPTVLPTDPATTIDPTVDPTTPTDPTATTDPTVPSTPVATVDPTAPTDPLASTDPVTTPAALDVTVTVDPTTLIDPISTVTPVLPFDPSTPVSTPIDVPVVSPVVVTPVVVTVPIVDQTDLGDSTPTATPVTTPTTPTASTSTSDSGGATTTASAAPVTSTASTPVVSQPTDESAVDSDPVFMHLSMPPVLGGNHDGVSGFHPVYVPVASNTQQSSIGDVGSATRQTTTVVTDSTTAQTQSHSSSHENLTSVATTVALQTAFSSTLIPAAQPATPPAAEPAPAVEADPVAVVVDHSMDVTGSRDEAATPLVEEHLKLTKLVWTFPTIDNQQPADQAAATPRPQAQTASAKVAPVTAATTDDGPAIIQLVQEIDVAPTDAATQAVAQASGNANPRIVEVPVVRAGVTNVLNDSTGRSRNIMFAVVAGVASLAVQSYRSSRRKLAAAARAAHLDPLAAWLDDPEFDRRH